MMIAVWLLSGEVLIISIERDYKNTPTTTILCAIKILLVNFFVS
jgi:hypothetical protein